MSGASVTHAVKRFRLLRPSMPPYLARLLVTVVWSVYNRYPSREGLIAVMSDAIDAVVSAVL